MPTVRLAYRHVRVRQVVGLVNWWAVWRLILGHANLSSYPCRDSHKRPDSAVYDHLELSKIPIILNFVSCRTLVNGCPQSGDKTHRKVKCLGQAEFIIAARALKSEIGKNERRAGKLSLYVI
jgi:hypothetical protein